MRDIIYEIHYRYHVQREHASYTRKNRRSIFYLTHYTYQYILKSYHINIFTPLSKSLLNHFQPLLNMYQLTFEVVQ